MELQFVGFFEARLGFPDVDYVYVRVCDVEEDMSRAEKWKKVREILF